MGRELIPFIATLGAGALLVTYSMEKKPPDSVSFVAGMIAISILFI